MRTINPKADSHCAFIALGSNLGDRRSYLRSAVAALQELGGTRASSVYETAPVGYADQPAFLNMVVELRTNLRPLTLLQKLLDIEHQHGRIREIRFGPRTLDCDLLLYDDEYICFRDLQVPHPRMWERAFVLVPLTELSPERKGLGGLTVEAMARKATREGEIRCVGHLRQTP